MKGSDYKLSPIAILLFIASFVLAVIIMNFVVTPILLTFNIPGRPILGALTYGLSAVPGFMYMSYDAKKPK